MCEDMCGVLSCIWWIFGIITAHKMEVFSLEEDDYNGLFIIQNLVKV